MATARARCLFACLAALFMATARTGGTQDTKKNEAASLVSEAAQAEIGGDARARSHF